MNKSIFEQRYHFLRGGVFRNGVLFKRLGENVCRRIWGRAIVDEIKSLCDELAQCKQVAALQRDMIERLKTERRP